jgi:hypothetical protein
MKADVGDAPDEEWTVQNASEYQLLMLRTFSHVIDAELAAFAANQRNADAEKEIFKIMINTAFGFGVLDEKVIQEALYVDGSTVSRWKNGISTPSKIKQIRIMELMQNGIKGAILNAEKQDEEIHYRLSKQRIVKSR